MQHVLFWFEHWKRTLHTSTNCSSTKCSGQHADKVQQSSSPCRVWKMLVYSLSLGGACFTSVHFSMVFGFLLQKRLISTSTDGFHGSTHGQEQGESMEAEKLYCEGHSMMGHKQWKYRGCLGKVAGTCIFRQFPLTRVFQAA